jgi:hypothetical protein
MKISKERAVKQARTVSSRSIAKTVHAERSGRRLTSAMGPHARLSSSRHYLFLSVPPIVVAALSMPLSTTNHQL